MITSTVPEVKPIRLTSEETKLRQQLEAEYSRETGYVGQAARELFRLLQSRGAIPQQRLDDFTKPFPGGRGKSHKAVFEQRGFSGDAIYKHSHFVPYLRYFMDGPALPISTIEGIRKILIDDAGTRVW